MSKRDPGLKMIRRLLKAHFRSMERDAYIIVRHGFRDNIHIWVVAEVFEPMTSGERHDSVLAVMDALPFDVMFRVSVLLLLTPEEYRDQMEIRRRFG